MTAVQQWVASQTSPQVPVNENFETMSAAALYGKRQPVTTGLTWGYYGGLYNGNTIADGTVTLTNTADNYVVVLRSTGVVSVSTSSTNSLDPLYAKLYKVTCAGGVVTAVVDQRWDANGLFFSDGGSSSGATEFIGVTFTSDTEVASPVDPGAGILRWNNSTQASATALFFDNLTNDAVSLTTFYGNLATTGFIYLQQADDSTKRQLWRWSAQVDSSGYRTFTVTLQASWGSIADNKNVYVLFQNGSTSGGGGGTIGKHMLPVMAPSMTPRAASPCGTLTVDGGATDQPDVAYLPFSSTSVEYAVFAIAMPESWDEGTITFRPIWKHPATTTNFGVVFSLQAVAFSDDDALAANFGTAQTSTKTGGTTGDQYIGPESSAITVAGTPQAGDTVFFRIGRQTGDAGDTMAVDAHLIGLRLYYTTAAETD